METLRVIKHDETHTDIEALIYGEWVVVKCILEDTMSPKSPVTVQEMDRVASSIGLKMYNDQAMKKVCLMVRIGFDATLEMYQREERNTNEAEQRKQAAEVANDDKRTGSAFEALDTIGMFQDGRNEVENEQIVAYFGRSNVTTFAEWRKRHLHQTAEQVNEAKANAEVLKGLRS